MTAIALTCAIYVACLVASGLLAFPIRTANSVGFADARRTILAVYRAADAGLTRSLRALGGVVGGLILAWALASVCVIPSTTLQASATQLGHSVLAGLVGVASACLLAFGAIRWARSASIRTIVAAHSTSDRLLLTVLRSSLLLTVGVEVFGFAVCLAAVGISFLSQSAETASASIATLPNTIHNLTSLTVGALLASYSVQASGATYRAAARAGTSTATHDAGLSEVDARNPSAIAETAGVQLGHLIPQVLDSFCSALCANLLVTIVLWRLLGSASTSECGYLLIPAIVRAFGGLAIVFGLGGARTLESVNPASALLRSQAVVIVISIGAIWGTCYWLVPEIGIRISLCATLGLGFPIAIGHWQSWILNRQLQPNRVERGRQENPWGVGLSLGMVTSLVPLLALVGIFAVALHIGNSLPIVHGRVLAVTVCLLAMTVVVPITASLQAASPLVFLARRTSFLSQRRDDEKGRLRLTRLHEAVRSSASWATSVQTAYGLALPLLASAIIGMLAKDSSSHAFGAESLAAVVAAIVGVILPVALRLRTSVKATQALVGEVRRQLNGARREPVGGHIPPTFTPSYRNCVDIAARESARHLSVSAAVTCVPGLLLGLALIWLTKNPGLVGQALALYLGQAAIAAFVAGFVLEVAIDFTSVLHARSSRFSTLPDIATGDCAIQILAASSTPAMRLWAKTSVVAALTFIPYMF